MRTWMILVFFLPLSLSSFAWAGSGDGLTGVEEIARIEAVDTLKAIAGTYEGFSGFISATGGSAGEFKSSCDHFDVRVGQPDPVGDEVNIFVCLETNQCVSVGFGYQGGDDHQSVTASGVSFRTVERDTHIAENILSHFSPCIGFGCGSPPPVYESKAQSLKVELDKWSRKLNRIRMVLSDSSPGIENRVDCSRKSAP